MTDAPAPRSCQTEVITKGHKTHNQAKKRFMTFAMYEDFAAKPKGGRLTPDQIRTKWQAMLADTKVGRGNKGIDRGVGGQVRLNLATVDEQVSSDEEGEVRQHKISLGAVLSTLPAITDALRPLAPIPLPSHPPHPPACPPTHKAQTSAPENTRNMVAQDHMIAHEIE